MYRLVSSPPSNVVCLLYCLLERRALINYILSYYADLPVPLMIERTAKVELGYFFVLTKFMPISEPISLDYVYRYILIIDIWNDTVDSINFAVKHHASCLALSRNSSARAPVHPSISTSTQHAIGIFNLTFSTCSCSAFLIPSSTLFRDSHKLEDVSW